MKFTIYTLLATVGTASAATCWNAGPKPGDAGAIAYAISDYCSSSSTKNYHRWYVGNGAVIEISGTFGANTQGCFGALQNIFSQCGVNGGHWEYDQQTYRVDQK